MFMFILCMCGWIGACVRARYANNATFCRFQAIFIGPTVVFALFTLNVSVYSKSK